MSAEKISFANLKLLYGGPGKKVNLTDVYSQINATTNKVNGLLNAEKTDAKLTGDTHNKDLSSDAA